MTAKGTPKIAQTYIVDPTPLSITGYYNENFKYTKWGSYLAIKYNAKKYFSGYT